MNATCMSTSPLILERNSRAGHFSQSIKSGLRDRRFFRIISTRRAFARRSCQEYGAGLMCVVQYPLGRVFVSAPDPSQDFTGGRGMKRTKNIQKKSLPALRREEQRLVVIVGIAGAHRSICNNFAKRWLTRVVRTFEKSRIYGGCRDSRCLAGLKRRNNMNPRAEKKGADAQASPVWEQVRDGRQLLQAESKKEMQTNKNEKQQSLLGKSIASRNVTTDQRP